MATRSSTTLLFIPEASNLTLTLSSSINMDVRYTTPEPAAPPSSPTDSNIDHITSLEQSLCSDFVCCGAHLPDFHALLEHFEEDHIMVLAPNGKRVYPPEGLRAAPLHPITTSLHSTPSSSRSSSVLSSPNSASCPLTPTSPDSSSLSDLSSCLQGTFERRKSSISVAPVYTPFTPSIPADPAYPEIDMPLYDFSQDFYPTYPVQLPASHFDDEEDMSDSGINDLPTSLIPTYVYGPDKSHPIAQIPKTTRSPTLDGALRLSISKNGKAKNRHLNPNHTPTSRRREKAYRCPTPRCTKSYLNPNGLKYHLEKGTCKIESDIESEASEESNLLPAATITVTTSPRLSVPQHCRQPLSSPDENYAHQQQHAYRHEAEDQESSPSKSEPNPLPSRQSHQQYPSYQYPYQYPPARPVYTTRVTTPIAISTS